VVRLTSTSGAVLDIVAGTLVVERDGDLPDLGGASVTAYDQKCQPVWHQIFPALSEVGLKVLDVVGGPMLRVTAQSGYRFADQQAFVDELFIQIDGTLTPLAPMALGRRPLFANLHWDDWRGPNIWHSYITEGRKFRRDCCALVIIRTSLSIPVEELRRSRPNRTCVHRTRGPRQ
jgi:hypothetical protein